VYCFDSAKDYAPSVALLVVVGGGRKTVRKCVAQLVGNVRASSLARTSRTYYNNNNNDGQRKRNMFSLYQPGHTPPGVYSFLGSIFCK
jgi:hypothetical protein